MKRKSRRISNGFGYIGFGNKQSAFNQKNENPFTLIKERLHQESHYHFKLDFKHEKLSKADKIIIKNKIRKAEKTRNLKTLFVFIFIASIIGVFIKLSIDLFVSRL